MPLATVVLVVLVVLVVVLVLSVPVLALVYAMVQCNRRAGRGSP